MAWTGYFLTKSKTENDILRWLARFKRQRHFKYGRLSEEIRLDRISHKHVMV